MCQPGVVKPQQQGSNDIRKDRAATSPALLQFDDSAVVPSHSKPTTPHSLRINWGDIEFL